MTLDEVMARTDHAVVHASPYFLATANKLLTDAAKSPLTQAECARWRLIQSEVRRRGMDP